MTTPNATKGSDANLSNVEGPPSSYEVGYRKPPQANQFKPGQSGNPKGRPKSNPTVSDLMRKILWGKVQMRTGDKIQKVARLEAILLKLIESSLKGDARAITNLLKLTTTLGVFKQTIESRFEGIANDDINLHRLTDDELNKFDRILAKLS